MILSDEVEVRVAVENDEVIASGYARIEISKPYLKHIEHAYFGFMFVKESHRGRGINKLVMESLYAWVVSKGVKEVELDVYSDNINAIKAYEKAGFKKNLLKMSREI